MQRIGSLANLLDALPIQNLINATRAIEAFYLDHHRLWQLPVDVCFLLPTSSPSPYMPPASGRSALFTVRLHEEET